MKATNLVNLIFLPLYAWILSMTIVVACGGKGKKDETKTTVTGPQGTGCTIEPTDNGAIITCGDSVVLIRHGADAPAKKGGGKK